MTLLTKEDLDTIEKRYINGCKGVEDVPATVMEQMRRVLVDNARLVLSPEHDGDSDYLDDADMDNCVPFPIAK